MSKPLTKRMHAAAKALEEASARQSRFEGSWTPRQLRMMALRWEEEDKAAERGELAYDERGRSLYQLWANECTGLTPWEALLPSIQRTWRLRAKRLAQDGWTRQTDG